MSDKTDTDTAQSDLTDTNSSAKDVWGDTYKHVGIISISAGLIGNIGGLRGKFPFVNNSKDQFKNFWQNCGVSKNTIWWVNI